MNFSFKEYLRLGVRNARGWRTTKKIVILESDDWGSIRTSGTQAFEQLVEKGYPLDQCVFNTYDSLETVEDIHYLESVLQRVIDKNGRPAIMTLNYIMANPDFDKIKRSGFETYAFVPFTKTMEEYDGHHRAYDAVVEGIKKNVFRPQFHGREHVRPSTWLKDLQEGDAQALEAFQWRMFTSSKGRSSTCPKEYLDAFGGGIHEMDFMIQSSREGLDMFQQYFSYASKSLIAGCYIWRHELEKHWRDMGITFLQGGRAQLLPGADGQMLVTRKHFTGEKNEAGQTYLIRNVYFEPVTNPNTDWIDRAMLEVKMAFLLGKPAIINTHRVNYAGRLHESNRAKNLALLQGLLVRILKTWPDVEFMATDELGELIQKTN